MESQQNRSHEFLDSLFKDFTGFMIRIYLDHIFNNSQLGDKETTQKATFQLQIMLKLFQTTNIEKLQ